MTSITPNNEGVAFTVGDQEWRADWLVAADGAGGQIRHWLGVESDGPGDMGHFLNTYFRASYGSHLAGRRSRLFTIVTEKRFESLVSVNGDDLWLMHHFFQPGETAADFPSEKLARMIQEASGLPEVPVEVLSVSPWIMSPKVSRKYRVGRVLSVGDAAARLSPAGGLGMNTGLQSVHNLAWKLAMVSKGQARPKLLNSYEEERHGAAAWTMEHTNRKTGEMFGIDAVLQVQLHRFEPKLVRIDHFGPLFRAAFPRRLFPNFDLLFHHNTPLPSLECYPFLTRHRPHQLLGCTAHLESPDTDRRRVWENAVAAEVAHRYAYVVWSKSDVIAICRGITPQYQTFPARALEKK